MLKGMRQGFRWGAPWVALLLLSAGCAEPSFDSVLPARPGPAVTGPAYVVRPLAYGPKPWQVVIAGREASLGSWIIDTTWMPNGHLLIEEVKGPGRPAVLRVVDPQTGTVIADRRGEGLTGVTGEAITVLHPRRNVVRVFGPDMSVKRVINVSADVVDTDQLNESGSAALFSLHHTPFTLEGVTWVQWGIESENDTLTDHGLLRIENGTVQEALRNQPLVSLWPASDGSALLALMQDNGEDESCGGCVVAQKIVELDPKTGAVAVDYGTPDGYSDQWRVERMDKIGERLVVRYQLRENQAASDPRPFRQTWIYDGGWEEFADVRDGRTTWQAGGRLTWTQDDPMRDEGEGPRYTLVWTPASGELRTLIPPSDPCPRRYGSNACTMIEAPGSMLPPD